MNDDLRSYITEMLKLSYDYSFIQEELLRAGWDESSIEKAFHDYKEEEKEGKSDDERHEELYEAQVAKPKSDSEPEDGSEMHTNDGAEEVPALEVSDVKEEAVDAAENVPQENSDIDVEKKDTEDGGLVGVLPEKSVVLKDTDDIPRGAGDLKHPPKKEVSNSILNKKETPKKKIVEPKKRAAGEKHSIAVPLIAGTLSLLAGIAFGYYSLSMSFYDLSLQPDIPEESMELEQ